MSGRCKIRVLNPNSSRHVTEGMAEALTGIAHRLNVDLDCGQLDQAPPAIETAEDIRKIEPMIEADTRDNPADAHVIACFSDPGVARLRGNGAPNTFGIAESAMLMAAGIPGSFGIISILDASVARHRVQVANAGLETRLAGDLALNLGVLDLQDRDRTRARLHDTGLRLKRDHDATSLILGCAGMAGFRAWLQKELDIPVIDPCQAAVAMAAAHLAITQQDS